eukprot:m51a1_g6730 putative transaldolase (332) ;mRNA; f:192944-194162
MTETEESSLFNVVEETTSLSPNALEELRSLSNLCVDSAEYDRFKVYYPHDALMNPTLILQAIRTSDEYRKLFETICNKGKTAAVTEGTREAWVMDRVLVEWAFEVLEEVPGNVIVAVDPRLSFSTKRTIAKARSLSALLKERGVPLNRAIHELKQEDGFKCNATLVFSMVQAAKAAAEGAAIVTPFVSRTDEWYRARASTSPESATGAAGRGVELVREVYNYVHANRIKETAVAASSLHSVDQILQLAGCDSLTITPELLCELVRRPVESVKRALSRSHVETKYPAKPCGEDEFRWELNSNAMATDLLADGIRGFAGDMSKLEEAVREYVS